MRGLNNWRFVVENFVGLWGVEFSVVHFCMWTNFKNILPVSIVSISFSRAIIKRPESKVLYTSHLFEKHKYG